MLFNSVQFICFFSITVLVLFLIPKSFRKFWLLAASLYFYSCWNMKYTLLLLTSIILTFLAGIFIERIETRKNKKIILGLGICSNLGILFLFKYFNFFLESINYIAGTKWNILKLILPVGISFYIFQALGYIIDVYTGKIHATNNLFDYALFISFFPQLVAGPIERADRMLFQIGHISEMVLWQEKRIARGLILMGWGMVQKVVISDRIALVVDTIYNNYSDYGLLPLSFSTILFAFQIYCDFAGYTSIARGAAYIMGFDLVDNFRQPYFAQSIADFWKRWHISLTNWFRDYLYIPLGGNRKGTVKTYINILIVFLVSGLWHGAEWTFVIWGGLHGVMQIVSHIKSKFIKNKSSVFSVRLIRRVLTFIFVDFAWLFFRATNLTVSIDIIKNMLSRTGDFTMITECLNISDWRILFIFLGILLFVDYLKEQKVDIISVIFRQQIWFRYVVYVSIIVACIYLGPASTEGAKHSFIYFQF